MVQRITSETVCELIEALQQDKSNRSGYARKLHEHTVNALLRLLQEREALEEDVAELSRDLAEARVQLQLAWWHLGQYPTERKRQRAEDLAEASEDAKVELPRHDDTKHELISRDHE